MAESKPLTVLEQRLSPKFAREYARLKSSDDLHFAQEKLFFLSLVNKSKDLRAAIPESLFEAFRQAAVLGLSFNPQLGHCYLIPRKMSRKDQNSPIIAYASPGYRGLLHLAITGGAIKWGRAEIVHERDHFRYFGPTAMPEFVAGGQAVVNSLNVNRGAKVGVFCHARTPSGDDMSGMMDAAAIAKVRARSEMPNSLMYTEFPDEAWKKIILRREFKTWTQTKSAALLQRAIEDLNTNEGLIEGEPPTTLISDAEKQTLRAMLTEAGLDEEKSGKWLGRLARLFGCSSLDDLPEDRFIEARDRLQNEINNRKAK